MGVFCEFKDGSNCYTWRCYSIPNISYNESCYKGSLLYCSLAQNHQYRICMSQYPSTFVLIQQSCAIAPTDHQAGFYYTGLSWSMDQTLTKLMAQADLGCSNQCLDIEWQTALWQNEFWIQLIHQTTEVLAMWSQKASTFSSKDKRYVTPSWTRTLEQTTRDISPFFLEELPTDTS